MATTLTRPKSFKVRFYEVDTRQPEDGPAWTAVDLFRELRGRARGHNGLCPQYESGGRAYEIRELRSINRDAVFTGVFAVMRDDAPHIRAGNGDERNIDLDQDEGVIEKNHFIFYADRRLLVYQVNAHANHPSRLEEYLTNMAGAARRVTLCDILTLDAWEQMRRGIVQKVHVVLSTPRNAERYDPEDFGGGTMRTMERAGATRAEIALSVPAGRGALTRWVKESLFGLRQADNVKSLRVKLDGEENMLDLLANTLRDEIQVEMYGRYPGTRQTLEELQRAKDRNQGALDAHFGT